MLSPASGLSNLVDAINRSRPIANKHLPFTIESQARRDAEVAHKRNNLSIARDAIHRPIKSTGHKHATGSIKGDAGWVHDVAREIFDYAFTVDSIERHRHMLSART